MVTQSRPCHRCDIDHLHEPYFNHFISSHSTIGVSPTTIVRQLADGDLDVLPNSFCSQSNLMKYILISIFIFVPLWLPLLNMNIELMDWAFSIRLLVVYR